MACLLGVFSFAAKPTNEACRALCIRDGNDGGQTHKKGCVCIIIHENFDDFLRGRVSLGSPSDLDQTIVMTHVPLMFRVEEE